MSVTVHLALVFHVVVAVAVMVMVCGRHGIGPFCHGRVDDSVIPVMVF